MKKAILSSLMLSSGSLALLKGKQSFADDDSDLLIFCIDARGAWDPSSFCDPLVSNGFYREMSPSANEPLDGLTQGSTADGSTNQFSINERLNYQDSEITFDGRFVPYGESDLQHLVRSDGSSLVVAPLIGNSGTPNGTFMVGGDNNPTDFFDTYKDDLVIINGVNTRTNAHPVGRRLAWSGRLRVGAPHLAALWGAIKEQQRGAPYAMTFTASGGFDATAGLLSVARAGNQKALIDLTDVYAVAPYYNNYTQMLSTGLIDKIKSYETSKENRLRTSSVPPHVKANIEKLQTARLAESDFQLLADALEQTNLPWNEDDGIFAQAHILVSAMRAGICKGAMLSFDAFDSHGDHFINYSNNGNHPARLKRLFDYTHYVRTELENAGLWERSIIILSSDFGRTRLNGEVKGKDHAPVTSMMIMGGDNTGVGSGKTMGYSYIRDIPKVADGILELEAAKYSFAGNVKLEGGQLVNAYDLNEGFNITPGHVHYALRELLGINGNVLADTFALDPEFSQTVYPFFEGV